eukprot:COSAG02_NODE_119_length_35335_cov_12.823192_12_plen_96_part_00
MLLGVACSFRNGSTERADLMLIHRVHHRRRYTRAAIPDRSGILMRRTAHRWVRDRHAVVASAGVCGTGAFAGGCAHLNVMSFEYSGSDSIAAAYL